MRAFIFMVLCDVIVLVLVALTSSFIFAVLIIVLWALIKKPFYSQIGPTCGFYALVYAVGKVKKINKKAVVRRIIIESIMERYSEVGEIFEIQTFESIMKAFFPNSLMSIETFEKAEDLDELLKDNYLIYPVLSGSNGKIGDTPHYYFIEMEKDGKYLYRTGVFCRSRLKEKAKMMQENANIKNLKKFCWKKYYRKIKFFSDIMNYVLDPKLAVFLIKSRKDKRKTLINEHAKIDLAGKVLAIKKCNN